MKKNDGGPAFPRAHYADGEDCEGISRGGMSLRDWFAGQAFSHLSQPILAAMHKGHRVPTSGEIVHLCYELADAMLKERVK